MKAVHPDLRRQGCLRLVLLHRRFEDQNSGRFHFCSNLNAVGGKAEVPFKKARLASVCRYLP